MQKKIHSDKAPAAVGPYSQAIELNGMIYTAGQIPLTPAGEMLAGDIQAKTAQCFENLKAVLEEAGSGLDKIVKVTVFVKDIADFPQINETYATFFAEPYPARSLVQAACLPKDADIEIECIAFK